MSGETNQDVATMTPQQLYDFFEEVKHQLLTMPDGEEKDALIRQVEELVAVLNL